MYLSRSIKYLCNSLGRNLCWIRLPTSCANPAAPFLLFMNYNVIVSHSLFRFPLAHYLCICDFVTRPRLSTITPKRVLLLNFMRRNPLTKSPSRCRRLFCEEEEKPPAVRHLLFDVSFQLYKIFPFMHEFRELRSNCLNASMPMETFAIASAFNLK